MRQHVVDPCAKVHCKTAIYIPIYDFVILMCYCKGEHNMDHSTRQRYFRFGNEEMDEGV